MAEQLGSNQGGQKLLAGRGNPRPEARYARPNRPPKEIMVVNARKDIYGRRVLLRSLWPSVCVVIWF